MDSRYGSIHKVGHILRTHGVECECADLLPEFVIMNTTRVTNYN